ncbi:oligosaccharide flippase family protein [Halogeometricum luteum]|uniref:Oligosaccharide flippase family protein n=1 Tax=Halogeometricum luteum TaxID=2950537 RepID=A0ABU2G4E7_9EURY|nr:oligosaccharide flippase family protein [Halogeometricum sp. S3BR5-2]MDS0295677.1 oligosaccharide flippase family protein [Halogeometricum sp. S3BR5-2]
MDVSRSSTLVFLASVGTTVAGFVGHVYFARVLGPELLGAFFLFQALLTVCIVGTDLGVGTGVEKQLSGASDREETFSTAVVFYAVTVGVVVCGILLFSDTIDRYVGIEVAALLAVAVCAKQCKRLLNTTLKGELRVGEISGPMLADRVGWVAVGAALLALGFGVESLVYGTIFGSVVGLVWIAAKIDTSFTRPSFDRLRSLLGFAKYNFVPSLGLQVHNWMDVLVIGYFLSQSAVGAYETAWKVSTITTVLATSVSTTVLPQTSAWDSGEKLDRIEDLLSSAITPSILLVVPAFFGVVALAPNILGLLFGPEFTVASLALVVLVAGKVPEAIQLLVGRCLLGMDRPNLVARATVWTIGLNLLLNVVLVVQFGLVGAAVATTASFTVGLILRAKYLSALMDLRIPYREVGWCVVASVGMYAAVVGVTSAFPADTLPRLFGVVLLAAVVYGAILLLFGRLRTRAMGLARRFSPL